MELETKNEKEISIDLIKEFEKQLSDLPQLDIQTTHRFLEGMYSREVMMPKGSIVTSKTHNVENLTIISKGKCIEVTEEHGGRLIEAPCTMISPPGVKRALYMLEDTVWTTVHYNPTNTQDLSELEQKIIKYEGNLIENEVKKCLG